MRAITKGREPASLTVYRQTPGCSYDGYTTKEELRQSLVSEQRGLCCYCMGRIQNGPMTMKIEHWQCQAHHPVVQLNYRNLLGACMGGEGQPHSFQHCDTRKGTSSLKWNPATAAHRIETRIRYGLDGAIESDDADFEAQLNDVLNLNLPWLKNNRKGALSGLLAAIGHDGPLTAARIERAIERHTQGTAFMGAYSPFAIWWLRRKLGR